MKMLSRAALAAVLVLSPLAAPFTTVLAQQQRPAPSDDPIVIDVEIYIVSLVTLDDGTREERFREATEARPGQTVEYRLVVRNVSEETLPPGIVVVTSPVPEGTEYIDESATEADGLLTEFSADRGRTFSQPPVIVGSGENRTQAAPSSYDTIRWTVEFDLEPGQEVELSYRVVIR
jgi:uncharacterized repeat protein (TIGR01451 family)